MKTLVSRCLFALLCLSAVAGALPVQAAVLTLTDQNSVVNMDDTSSAGVFQWSVDGVNQLFQQWFWYRIGATGGELPINSLGAPTGGTTSANSATFSYLGTSGLAATLSYNLTGGAPGSGASDLGESIRLVNTSGQSMDLHFFQYSDFDLNGTTSGDVVQFINSFTVDQYKITGGTKETLQETVATPAANHFEGNFFAATLNSLNDGNPTTLSDSPAVGTPLGPGDMTWAYEWDRTLAPGGQLIINKDKGISVEPVPEPTSCILSVFAGICLMLRASRWCRR
jgi:hypothetical protein